ncbi:MAG: Serine threonine kinase [Lasallia pustulata]|uniref:non-specific serine/threonine protein kinase n=1 Tax=Lasallia pustulata TaxID=136370 RepID=A0A5M8Q1Q2_9LECA|nr:MAG: Serine threonine kinase [Lasallia pustulata]
MIAHSQLAPLPSESELPFRIISKTIGQGAIKKAVPVQNPKTVIAVKFIHKDYALRHGRVTQKQLDLETTLHRHLGYHANIIQFFRAGEDATWRWIAMELAEGGDLFDKIESDVGVGEDIAHLYFTQLISAVGYMHSMGVGHRDIKPENILLSAEGNLKIADFGLSTLFSHKGMRKICTTSCGSPPYTAPEVVTCDTGMGKKLSQGYYGDLVDIWSCGVVLFVLLVGNTPWDEPLERSYEFNDYVTTNGRPDDELWRNLPAETLSLLRGIMRVDPTTRFSLEDVRRHPWFTRKNAYLGPDGALANPIALATQMFESMRIDFNQDPMASQRSQRSADTMEIDSQDWNSKFASTQPETPVHDIAFDWERPPWAIAHAAFSASQPATNAAASWTRSSSWDNRLAEEPSFSQFYATPSVPLSRTQYARRFRDIIPSHSLTRFFSLWSFAALLPIISESLHRLSVPVPTLSPAMLEARDEEALIKVKTTDSRNCPITGHVLVERIGAGAVEEALLEVNFIKMKGDPVEWRRFFKKVVVLCKDAVYKPEN